MIAQLCIKEMGTRLFTGKNMSHLEWCVNRWEPAIIKGKNVQNDACVLMPGHIPHAAQSQQKELVNPHWPWPSISCFKFEALPAAPMAIFSLHSNKHLGMPSLCPFIILGEYSIKTWYRPC